MKSSYLLTGINLKPQHYDAFLEKKSPLAWVEVHSENYFVDGGPQLQQLQKVRADYPVSLHGVSLSLGSSDELNWQYLKKLSDLIARIDPCLVSDHLAWSSLSGQYFHDLFPLPFTDETLNHLVNRIQQVQDYLKRQILIENISSYTQFVNSTFTEQEFLVALARRAGCGILLDINNIYVSSCNLNFNAKNYLAKIPAELVQEIHLAGFTTAIIDEKEVLIDSHSRPIVPAVWDLYRAALKQLGAKPTIIEWDAELPTLDALTLEAFRAEKIIREIYGTQQFAT